MPSDGTEIPQRRRNSIDLAQREARQIGELAAGEARLGALADDFVQVSQERTQALHSTTVGNLQSTVVRSTQELSEQVEHVVGEFTRIVPTVPDASSLYAEDLTSSHHDHGVIGRTPGQGVQA